MVPFKIEKALQVYLTDFHASDLDANLQIVSLRDNAKNSEESDSRILETVLFAEEMRKSKEINVFPIANQTSISKMDNAYVSLDSSNF